MIVFINIQEYVTRGLLSVDEVNRLTPDEGRNLRIEGILELICKGYLSLDDAKSLIYREACNLGLFEGIRELIYNPEVDFTLDDAKALNHSEVDNLGYFEGIWKLICNSEVDFTVDDAKALNYSEAHNLGHFEGIRELIYNPEVDFTLDDAKNLIHREVYNLGHFEGIRELIYNPEVDFTIDDAKALNHREARNLGFYEGIRELICNSEVNFTIDDAKSLDYRDCMLIEELYTGGSPFRELRVNVSPKIRDIFEKAQDFAEQGYKNLLGDRYKRMCMFAYENRNPDNKLHEKPSLTALTSALSHPLSRNTLLDFADHRFFLKNNIDGINSFIRDYYSRAFYKSVHDYNNREQLSLLVYLGADINYQNEKGMTALEKYLDFFITESRYFTENNIQHLNFLIKSGATPPNIIDERLPIEMQEILQSSASNVISDGRVIDNSQEEKLDMMRK